MTISFNWLKEYFHTDKPAEEIAEILTAIGLEVEGIERHEWLGAAAGRRKDLLGAENAAKPNDGDTVTTGDYRSGAGEPPLRLSR